MKAQKEETPKKLLIYQDNDLLKYNRKVLEEVFIEVDRIKTMFTSLEVPWNQQQFIRLINEGSGFVTDFLFAKLAENYKGLSAIVVDSLTEVEKGKLQKIVIPFEPIIEKIKELLKKVDLTVDQLSLNLLAEPIINEKLKQILSEKSKRYAIGNEIELFHIIEEVIISCNKLEKSLAKNGFGLIFTKYLNFDFHLPNAESDSAFYPLCLVNYDNVLNDGHATLEMNPDYFEDIRESMKALSDRQNLEKEMRSLPPEVRFHENRGIDIPAASFKLKPDAGKQFENRTKTPAKDRWKGMPGMD